MKVESSSLPQSLVILTDCSELEREFLDDRVVCNYFIPSALLSPQHCTTAFCPPQH